MTPTGQVAPSMRVRWWRVVVALVVVAVVAGVLAVLAGGNEHPDRGTRLSAQAVQPSIDPARIPPTADNEGFYAGDLPECVPVQDNRGEVRGCVLRDEVEPRTWQELRVKRAEGRKFPVYDSNGQVVGYLVVGPLGFVDQSIGDDPGLLARLTDCAKQFSTGLSDACRSFLVSSGWLPE